MSAANDRWAAALAEWAIPEEILAAAPESPWGCPVGLFTRRARSALAQPRTVTHDAVAEVLPPDGALLDVGAGAGASSLPVAPPAGRVIAVDGDASMLAAFADAAAGRTHVQLVEGRWPDVAVGIGPVDVAVCGNVAYNVANLDAFVRALTSGSRLRVVLELTAVHPQATLSPLWERFWGLARPVRPIADDAIDVVREAVGLEPEVVRWTHTNPLDEADPLDEAGPQRVAWIRRRLCLPPQRDDEVVAAWQELARSPTSVVTMWWPSAGS